jgi:hypothetical protein
VKCETDGFPPPSCLIVFQGVSPCHGRSRLLAQTRLPLFVATGQCGLPPCRTLQVPHEVPLPRGVGRPVRVACGTHYTLVAFDTGHLVAFGRNSNGELVGTARECTHRPVARLCKAKVATCCTADVVTRVPPCCRVWAIPRTAL